MYKFFEIRGAFTIIFFHMSTQIFIFTRNNEEIKNNKVQQRPKDYLPRRIICIHYYVLCLISSSWVNRIY